MASTERMVSRAILSGAPLGNLRVTLLPCLGLSGNVYDRARQMPISCGEIWPYAPFKCLQAMGGVTSVYESGGQEFESLRARHLRQSTLQQPSSAIHAPCSGVALCENSVMCGPQYLPHRQRADRGRMDRLGYAKLGATARVPDAAITSPW